MTPWPIPFSLLVTSVYDGDTIDGDFTADAGLNVGVVFRGWRLRLFGINTPELRSTDPAVKANAYACRDYLRTLVAPGDRLSVSSYSFDNYGKRIDGIPTTSGGVDLCQAMLTYGHGTTTI